MVSFNLNNTIRNLNSSKYFAGLMILFLNLSSRYLALELSETQEQILSNKLIRRFIIFTVVFVSTRDIWVSMIDGEASIIINDSKAGLTAPSEDPERLAENILQLSKLDKKSIDKLGENALNYYNENFERTMLIDRLEKMFKNLISLNKNIP